jgi:hypothetical protein
VKVTFNVSDRLRDPGAVVYGLKSRNRRALQEC